MESSRGYAIAICFAFTCTSCGKQKATSTESIPPGIQKRAPVRADGSPDTQTTAHIPRPLRGIVTGLAGASVDVLINGQRSTVETDGRFETTQHYNIGTPYGAAIANQPPFRACAIRQLTHAIESTASTDIRIDCIKVVYVASPRVPSNGPTASRTTHYAVSSPLDGSSWTTAYPDLLAVPAELVLAGTHELWLREGVYSHAATSAFSFGSGMVIRGGFAGDESSPIDRHGDKTVIDLAGSTTYGHSFWGQNVQHATFDRLTIAHAQNGALRFEGTGLLLVDVAFSNNRANANGGALAFVGNGLVIRGCVFSENWAANPGGAIWIETASEVLVVDSHFLENASDTKGGALHVTPIEPGEPTTSRGLTVINTTFYRNRATQGSAISTDGRDLNINHGVFVENGPPTLRTNTPIQPAVIHARHVFVTNSIFFANGGLDPQIYSPTGGQIDTSFNGTDRSLESSNRTSNVRLTKHPYPNGPSPHRFDHVWRYAWYLDPASRAIDAGDDETADNLHTGLPRYGANFRTLTTSTSGTADASPVDLGYHVNLPDGQ